jgi:hypothetical protein
VNMNVGVGLVCGRALPPGGGRGGGGGGGQRQRHIIRMCREARVRKMGLMYEV